VWQDIKFALRMFISRPAFAAVTILALALGIGSTIAMFSVIETVFLRPLPYRQAERLFFIWPTNPKDGQTERAARLAEVEVLRDQLQTIKGTAVATQVWRQIVTTSSDDSSPINAIFASANLLEVLGVAPAYGRAFLPEEDLEGGPRVALLTHAAWVRRFGGNPAVVGTTLLVNGKATRIVGVLPPLVAFPDPSNELWLSLGSSPSARRWRLLTVVGRLAQGVREDQASAELAMAAHRLEAAFPDTNKGVGLRLVSLRQQLTGQARRALLLLFCAVALVLLIACANVANLMLARSLARRGEIALRVALGAGEGRLVRQLMTEGLLLALVAGAIGTILGQVGLDLLMSRSPIPLPSHYRAGIDGIVLGFALLVSLVTGVAFSLGPAWRLIHADPQRSLGQHGRGATRSVQHRRLSEALVVAEVALAVILLCGAGLLRETVQRLLAVDPGFVTRNLLTMQLYLPPGQEAERVRVLNREIEEQLRNLPGVAAIGRISRLPLAQQVNVTKSLEIEGRAIADGQLPDVDVRLASTDYFRAMGIAVINGRTVTDSDQSCVTINEATAKRFWPNGDPLGAHVRTIGSTGGPEEWHTVVGVVGSIRHVDLDVPPRPEIYYSSDPEQSTQNVLLRTTADPQGLIQPARAALLSLDRRMAITNVETMDGLVLKSTATRRFEMLLLGCFAVMALTLAAIGLYGLMSYAVAQRTREIGVRMALGAAGRDVSIMVIREGMTLVLIGAAIGLGGAFLTARLMSGLLYGVSGIELRMLLVVILVLGSVALLACTLAARRATTVTPMVTLRQG
jgi:putative ABC transport system permease protein